MQRRTFLVTAGVMASSGCAALVDDEDDQLRRALRGDSDGGATATPAADGESESETATPTATPEPDPAAFDPGAIEQRFIERFNEMRVDEELGEAHRDRFLSEMGQAHAKNMAAHDYIGHVEPDGMGVEGRYRDRGLLGECALEIPNSDQYYPGAENVAGSHVGRVTHPNTEETFLVLENDDVARFLLDAWMQSPPHRELMVLPSVDAIGLGTVVRADGEIFAALEFC